MRTETIQLFDGTEIVYVWQSQRRYVRITKNTITIHYLRKGKK